MVAAQHNRAAPWLARVVGAVQRAPARAAVGARARSQVMIDAQQQRVELRVVQQGMAHWAGLFSSVGPRVGECTVPKIGRNDPCPCGSGKKYKHCCLEKDREAELAPAVTHITQRLALDAQKANQAAQLEDDQAALLASQALDAASNAVVDLVHAGRLDEAEQAARELLINYPEVHDGHDRLGMVHEARGQFREAADSYRLVVELMRANPEDYDAGFVESFLERIVKLEACVVEAQRALDDDARHA
jgi:TolA-binding protein